MAAITKFKNLDTDNTLGGNNASDDVISSQKSIKEYVDSQINNSLGDIETLLEAL